MKPLTYLTTAFFLMIASVGFAQPVVRIPADIFLETISTHPDIRANAEQLGLTGAPRDLGKKSKKHRREAEAQYKKAVADHSTFVNEFNNKALLVYQQCWMLEQQIIENAEYRKDILSIRIIDSRLLMKQQLLVSESNSKQRELKLKYAEAVNSLSDLTRHVFGNQPILPENCVLCFETSEVHKNYSEEYNTLTESYADLSKKIVAQEKLVTKISNNESFMLMKEFFQLHIYKTQRWQVLDSIVVKDAELFVSGGSYSVDQPVGGQ